MRRTELTALILLTIVLIGVIVLGAYNIIISAADLLTLFIAFWYVLTL